MTAPVPAPDVRPPPTLATTRLTLRPITHADVPAIFALFSDPVVTRYWSRPPMRQVMEARRLVASVRAGQRKGTLVQLGVELAGTGTLIGTCTLHAIHGASRRAELGYALAHAHWGRGYMHEALVRFVGYAFDELALHRLEADIDPDNVPSARSLRRLGFVREGLLRERWIVNDAISDSEMYGLLRHEWRQGAPLATGTSG